MAMSSIKIYRQYPIINGMVQLPLNRSMVKGGESGVQRPTLAVAESNIAGSSTVSLTTGSGPNTGSKFGSQAIFRLPPVAADSWYSGDPADIIIS
jgi:hypothetical protein